MTVLVDTNVLVYDTIENSQYHDRAGELIDNSEDPIINSLPIVELGFVLATLHIYLNHREKKTRSRNIWKE